MLSILTDRDASVRPVEGVPSDSITDGSWQSEMKNAVRSACQLRHLLKLPDNIANNISDQTGRAERDFPVFVPLCYVRRMRTGDPYDPLLRQVLPVEAENDTVTGYSADPVGDLAAKTAPGLLQKYQGRALLMTTPVCAVHCRYCFRRHYPYAAEPTSPSQWDAALDQIAADRSMTEVILSGGDPLTQVDQRLIELADRIATIGHVRRLRFHTRLPIVIPSRVTNELTDWIRGSRLQTIFVVHANHAQELDDSVRHAVDRLREAGTMLLNQAVLLRGVNDTLDALADLSNRLIEFGIGPYYLHQLDRVSGAAHFEVDQRRGQRLIKKLRQILPGYAVPRYVQEQPGQPNKTVLA